MCYVLCADAVPQPCKAHRCTAAHAVRVWLLCSNPRIALSCRRGAAACGTAHGTQLVLRGCLHAAGALAEIWAGTAVELGCAKLGRVGCVERCRGCHGVSWG